MSFPTIGCSPSSGTCSRPTRAASTSTSWTSGSRPKGPPTTAPARAPSSSTTVSTTATTTCAELQRRSRPRLRNRTPTTPSAPRSTRTAPRSPASSARPPTAGARSGSPTRPSSSAIARGLHRRRRGSSDVRDAIRAAASTPAPTCQHQPGHLQRSGQRLRRRLSRRRASRRSPRSIGTAVEAGRGGLGTTIVKAAGNARLDRYDVNADPWTNDTRQVIVAAVDRDGFVSAYSSYGAAVLVSAFGTPGQVVTTDRIGACRLRGRDYTRSFNGTSAATPMVSGVVALMYEAEPGPRLARRAVDPRRLGAPRRLGGRRRARRARSATPGPGTAPTTWNGGGQHFSNDYGYGLVDALRGGAAVRDAGSRPARRRRPAPTRPARRSTCSTARRRSPTATGTGLSFAGDRRLDHLVERVTVEVDLLDHLCRRPGGPPDLARRHGQRARRATWARRHAFDGSWTFESQAFRGERAAATGRSASSTASAPTGSSVSDIVVRTWGADDADDRFVFTDAYSDYAGAGGHATEHPRRQRRQRHGQCRGSRLGVARSGSTARSARSTAWRCASPASSTRSVATGTTG